MTIKRFLQTIGAGLLALSMLLLGLGSSAYAETAGSGEGVGTEQQTEVPADSDSDTDAVEVVDDEPTSDEEPSEEPVEETPKPEGAEQILEDPEPSQEPDGLDAESLNEGEESELSEEGMLAPLSHQLQSRTMAMAPVWVEQPNARIAGQDRYQTAVAVSKHAYPNGAATVLIATGADFPDALSAAALGAKIQAPLLLTEQNSLPASIAAEISRLKPSKIVIIGGPGVVSTQVESRLKGLGAQVSRVYGADRYATSAAIAKSGWSQSSDAFIATGVDFPDALSASAAAGKLGVPVVLVPGTERVAPSSVLNALRDLKVTKIHIAGGTGVVTTQMQSSVATSGRSVARYAGASRYDTSADLVSKIFSARSDTYWAVGYNFADALTGAAAAGAQGGALLLVEPDCVPTVVYRANDRVTSGRTYLLGGSGVLTDGVMIGNECMVQPSGINSADWVGTKKLYSLLNKARQQAGLSGFRVADAVYGTPAYSWSKGLGSGGAKVNSSLRTQQAWSSYQTVAQTNSSGDKPTRLSQLLTGDAQARSWLLKPNGGVRGAFSVGYATSGATGYATVIVGTNLR